MKYLGERPGGARKAPFSAPRFELGASGADGKRFSAPQIVWNRSNRRAGARGGTRIGKPWPSDHIGGLGGFGDWLIETEIAMTPIAISMAGLPRVEFSQNKSRHRLHPRRAQ